ncbi:MAG TPA: hypothetical protein VF889_06725 [Bacteroidota bacterium]
MGRLARAVPRCVLGALCLFPFFCAAAFSQEQLPVLTFPTPGLDDSIAYRDYATRFFRDSEGNAVQVVLNEAQARVVNLWADAANESISFTVKDPSGTPLKMLWVSPGAVASAEGTRRFLTYTLSSASPALEIGQFILGSMRKERDFQYEKRSLLPLDSLPPVEPELLDLLANLDRLPRESRADHVGLLLARSIDEIHARLRPRIELARQNRQWVVNVLQPTFDGRNLLSLQIRGDTAASRLTAQGELIAIRSADARPVVLTFRIGTNSPALTPLNRDQLFNVAFRRFYDRVKGAAWTSDSARRAFEQLEREVKSIELLGTRQKLMAGLPNFATYFGRDMMMSAMMLEPVLRPSVLEDVIAAVLRKLSPEGKVSHEESLGGQAIRENAAIYNRRIGEYLRLIAAGKAADAAGALKEASAVLEDLQGVREDYKMVDETFQLPVIAARYLSRTDVLPGAKRSFLLAPVGLAPAGANVREAGGRAAGHAPEGVTRLTLLLRNLHYLVHLTAPFAARQDALNLVSFPRLEAGRWLSGSWRDSGAGYANGRYALDVNAIWAPAALEGIRTIARELLLLNIPVSDRSLVNPDALEAPLRAWQRAGDFFVVKLASPPVARSIEARLSRLPAPEQEYWKNVVASQGIPESGISFLALSLDSLGHPIPVMNTDPATWLFLSGGSGRPVPGAGAGMGLEAIVRTFTTPYPVGLFVPGVGPLVANDVYASPAVWDRFEHDQYHSPRVVWGREVNLFLLGLSRLGSFSAALTTVDAAVDASGLKHSELWSYAITAGSLAPARYPASCDIQLWNLTDLAVVFELTKKY